MFTVDCSAKYVIIDQHLLVLVKHVDLYIQTSV